MVYIIIHGHSQQLPETGTSLVTIRQRKKLGNGEVELPKVTCKPVIGVVGIPNQGLLPGVGAGGQDGVPLS